MTHEEIYHAVEKFGDAAERVRRAGFDCVEIHAGHSYLISQFLSPLFNKRTDEFGGSVENRTRILSLIVDKVRACVGPRFPVSLRISADDFLKGGNTLEDSLRILELCRGEGRYHQRLCGTERQPESANRSDVAGGWLEALSLPRGAR